MIPLFHDVTDETVLVVGGGGVATRKVRRVADNARVVVVSPTFTAELRAFAGASDGRVPDGDDFARDRDGDDVGSGTDAVDVALVRARLAPGDLADWIDRADPALVVAATDDPAVNAAAEAAARERRVLVNRADEAGGRAPGSVVFPATVTDHPVTVAISTDGTSPALAGYLRERIDAEIDGAGAMAELTGELRADLKARGVDPATRREAIRAVVRSDAVWKALQTEDANARLTANAVVEERRDA